MSETVFVVGAGASVDFGLPTGPQLNRSISAAMALGRDDYHQLRWLDDDVNNAFRSWPGATPNQMVDASRTIVEGIAYHQSPDDFLFAFGNDQAVVDAGKAGIVASILKAERLSWLCRLEGHERDVSDEELAAKTSAWPLHLIKLLAPGIRASDPHLLFESVAFVNFNYDRCLEQILYHGLQRSHRLSADLAAKVVSRIQIIHPYGWIGRPAWLSGMGTPLPFGGRYGSRLPELASNIHTLTEGHNTAEERAALSDLMTSARRIVFLGFGFHPQNMNLIACEPRLDRADPTVLATAYGVPHGQREVFQRRIRTSLGLVGPDKPILGESVTTTDGFLAEYGIALVDR